MSNKKKSKTTFVVVESKDSADLETDEELGR
jgi:hypothetical protein